MRALAYLNERPLAMATGYSDGDKLVPSHLSAMHFVNTTTPEYVAQTMFAILNGDERPTADVERSLSVGDVVSVEVPPGHDGGTGYRVWLACDLTGWREIDEPR